MILIDYLLLLQQTILYIRPLGPCIQASKQDILITFVKTFCFDYLCK